MPFGVSDKVVLAARDYVLAGHRQRLNPSHLGKLYCQIRNEMLATREKFPDVMKEVLADLAREHRIDPERIAAYKAGLGKIGSLLAAGQRAKKQRKRAAKRAAR